MLERILNINNELQTSIFLFGARQTGKSTLLRRQCPNAVYIDLLDTEAKNRFSQRPGLLYETLRNKPSGTLVIIDEIPTVPELLNEVHRLITECHHTFVLCGSSARKLKRKGHNTLGGRAYPLYLLPLVSKEIPNFDINHAINFGLIPPHYLSSNPRRLLSAYIDIYLKEEIQQEALVRRLSSFRRFLEVAALTNGEIVNYNNIAQECGVSATTVRGYFDILEDTLVGYRIPAFRRVNKRRLIQAPRFYFFDVGVANHLLHRFLLTQGTPEYGHAFEHLLIQELYAYLRYTHSDAALTYWHTYTGIEVDAVLGDAQVAIEIKAVDEIRNTHLKGLKAFGEEYPLSRRIIVSLDRFSRTIGDIECIYVYEFLDMLWSGQLITE